MELFSGSAIAGEILHWMSWSMRKTGLNPMRLEWGASTWSMDTNRHFCENLMSYLRAEIVNSLSGCGGVVIRRIGNSPCFFV